MSATSSSSDEEILQDSVPLKWLLLSEINRSHFVHEVNQERLILGEYHHLFLTYKKKDPTRFYNYVRMQIPTFEYILNLVYNDLTKKWENCHKRPILPEERLVVTLRYLAEGMSFKSLSHSFRMGASTVAGIVKEVVTSLWNRLAPLHLPPPTCKQFLEVSQEYYKLWQFPHCLGAIDGKHVRIKCPPNTGSMFYNYKNYFSIVLQGVADANCRFIIIDVGGYGKQSDGGTFSNMKMYDLLVAGKMNIPKPELLPNSEVVLPYVFIADEAYPLMKNVMKPYSRSEMNLENELFNKRLSRARKCVERAFGILNSKWRVLNRPIEVHPDTVDKIVQALCVLHNTIIDKEGVPNNMEDTEIIISTETVNRSEITGRPTNEGKRVRDILKAYLCSNPL